jgi:hypothetical protein
MAGNIRFITRKPDATNFDAYAEADWSSIEDGGDGYGISAVINAPLIRDKLALRLVGYREDRDGWIDQVRLERTTGASTTFDGRAEDINSTEITGGRLSVRWTPFDALTIDAMYVKQNLDSDGSPRFTSKGVPAYPDQPPEIASLPGNTGFAPLPGTRSFTPDRDFINTDITRSPRKDDFDLFGATARYDTGIGNISLALSQYKHDIDFTFDSTPILLFFGVPIPGVHAAAAGIQDEDGGAALRFGLRFAGQLRHRRLLSEGRERVQRARRDHRRQRRAVAVRSAELG